MAIGTPTSIGSASSVSGSTTLAMTLTASVSIGQFVVVAAMCTGATGHTCTFSDSAGNTWATDMTSNGRASSNTFIGSAQITSAMTSGSSTITATFSTTEVGRLICAAQVSGIATSSAKDVSQTGNGTTVAWSSGATAATGTADELVVGACGNDATGAETSTPGAGYTELFDFTNTGGTQLTMVYQILAATGAQTASGTWTNSGTRSWCAGVSTYKAAAGGGGGTAQQTLTLTGVGS